MEQNDFYLVFLRTPGEDKLAFQKNRLEFAQNTHLVEVVQLLGSPSEDLTYVRSI